jgi:hypothetical protein
MNKIIFLFLLLLSNEAWSQYKYPEFSILINKELFNANKNTDTVNKKLLYSIQKNGNAFDLIELKNISSDTVEVSNLLPYGMQNDHVFITGLGNHTLSRTHLFIPGKKPVNVVCPDNAWELGFACIEQEGKQITTLTRRMPESITKGLRKRFVTILYPGGSVRYKRWNLEYKGDWQEGLRLVFQQQKLFDLDNFDNSLLLLINIGTSHNEDSKNV